VEWIRLVQDRRPVAGAYEHDNESSVSIEAQIS
jgi:hypothetical protein